MSKLAIIAVAAATVLTATPSFAGVLTCNIIDTSRNALTWEFGLNTKNKNGSIGGTMVENVFVKNKQIIASMPGSRPIWIWGQNQAGGVLLVQRSDENWHIGTSYDGGQATLFHNNQAVGWGQCQITGSNAVTAGNVTDQGL
jgi:hypothetical protein